MPVNYGMLPDPMANFNQGVQTLGQALMYRQNKERQARLDALNEQVTQSTLKTQGLQQTSTQMALDKAKAEEQAIMALTGESDPARAKAVLLKRKQDREDEEADRKTIHDTLSTLGTLVKNGADPEGISKIANNIIGKTRFKDDFQNIRFLGEEFTVEKDFPEGVIPDKTSPGSFLPAGRYKITAKPGGQGQPINFLKVDMVDPKAEGEFGTFKKGIQKTEGETDQQFAERVSSLWQKRKEDAVKAGKENAINDFTIFYKSRREEGKTDKQITDEWHEQKLKESMAAGEGRAKAYGDIRQKTYIDTKNNNDMIELTAAEFSTANKAEPGRYLDAGKAQKALTSTALLQDIRGAINNSRRSITNLKTDFDETSRLLLYKAVTSGNPTSAISNFINGQFGKALTTAQIDYLTDLQQLVENAMAMRAVLGAGQGSDQLRDAIKATIPNKGTFSKEMALAQLNKFEQQVNRLERGVPGIKLAAPKGAIETETATAERKTLNGKSYIKQNGKWYEE